MKYFTITISAASVLLLNCALCFAKPHAVFSSHQYGILDSTIAFSAKVAEPDRDTYTVYWVETRWFKEPRTLTETLNKTNNFESIWNLEFPSEDYVPGNYTITSSIIYLWNTHLPIPVELGTQLIAFTLTDNFSGKFVVNNVTRHRRNKSPTLVSAKNETQIHITVDNPGILQKATNVTWSWFVGNVSLANVTGPNVSYNFTEVKNYEITAQLEATFNNTVHPNKTVIKYGNFSTNITAKVPIMNVTSFGDTWYRNDGRLLVIKITCEGTGPYQYCNNITEGVYNITGNETCGKSFEMTNDCEIIVKRYLSEGIHTILTIIENDLGRYVNTTAIHVYKVSRVQPLSLILVPITCSLIALVLIIFGIGYFWENRKRFVVEVADFDFGQHDELPYMTFIERLKDAMSSNSVDRQRLIIAPPDDEPVLASRRSSQFS